jgi:succinyl-CoA synthetase alpha subunit
MFWKGLQKADVLVQDLYRITHIKHIKPVLQYGCEALTAATPAISYKLEVIKCQVLWLIKEAVKSTPQVSTQVLTMNNHLQF